MRRGKAAAAGGGHRARPRPPYGFQTGEWAWGRGRRKAAALGSLPALGFCLFQAVQRVRGKLLPSFPVQSQGCEAQGGEASPAARSRGCRPQARRAAATSFYVANAVGAGMEVRQVPAPRGWEGGCPSWRQPGQGEQSLGPAAGGGQGKRAGQCHGKCQSQRGTGEQDGSSR